MEETILQQSIHSKPNFEDLFECLRKVPFFENFCEEAVREVAAITSEQTFPSGSTIFREGDRGDALYIIKKGRITICKRNRMGVDVVIATLTDGAVIGDMALIDQQPRSATLKTVLPTTFYVIKEKDFQHLLLTRNEVTMGTLILLNDRIRSANERLIDFALDSHLDMVILTDTEYRVTDLNRRAQTVLKIDPEKDLSSGMTSKLECVLEKVRSQSQDRNPFFMILMKPERLYLWIHVIPIQNHQGFLQGYLIELRDITQVRDSSRRRLEIASFVIHRLPQLLDGWRPREEIETDLKVYVREQTELQRELNRQVNKLVAFTDLEAGPLRIQRMYMNPDELLGEVINDNQELLAEKKQSLEVKLEFGDGEIFADDDWVRKMLTILLVNAITYSEEGAVISVQTMQPSPGRLQCRIQNPIDFSVSEEQAHRYFDMAAQLEDFENLLTTDFGLELPLARHIIDAHNGWIKIESGVENIFSVVFEL